MRAATEISKISLRIKSYFSIIQILQQIQFVFIAFFCKIFYGIAFGISFLR